MEDEEQIYYNNITDVLVNTFGDVLTRDVIFTIVESYEGDLEQSANAIMNISMDGNCGSGDPNTDIIQNDVSDVADRTPDQNESYTSNANVNRHVTAESRVESNLQNILTQPDTSNPSDAFKTTAQSEIPTNMPPCTSYATASQNKVQSSHQSAKTSTAVQNTAPSFLTNQIKTILDNHEIGICTLIIMRGAPGSGKSYLARQIIDAVYKGKHSQYHIHILSTDDYFVYRGVYHYDKSRLSEAHDWNKNRAKIAMAQGISPVVIDNTNIELWEFESYFAEGVKNGYLIELVEPNTSWGKKANQLYKKSIHDVPLATIRRMLDNFQSGVIAKNLFKEFGLQYSPNKKPPVLRSIPPIKPALKEEAMPTTSRVKNAPKNKNPYVRRQMKDSYQTTITNNDIAQMNADNNEANTMSQEVVPLPDSQEGTNNLEKYEEIRKCLEEMEKVEQQWENGDNWEDDLQSKPDNGENSKSLDSKPQRRNKFSKHSAAEKLLPIVVHQDWSKCTMLLPSWEVNSNVTTAPLAQSLTEVKKLSSSTCIEYGDTDISGSKNPLKIIAAVPRNINEFHVPSNNKKIPEKWMLDKSTSTNNNDILTGNGRCQNEEQHFEAFRKLFRNVPKSDLKDIFDNCCGDVNWAVDLVLDSIDSKEIEVTDNNDPSDTEDEHQNTDLCECLSAYNIIPHHNEPLSSPVNENEDKNSVQLPMFAKKGKKASVSDAGLLLKKQIEQNVVISENHYSEHCLKIRKMRRGEFDIDKENKTIDDCNNPGTSEEPSKCLIESETQNLSKNLISSENCTPSTSKMECTETSDEDPFAENDDVEKTINIDLGKEFIVQLDQLFGRPNMVYPPNLDCRINIPQSTLNEINALWVQTLMHQLETDEKQHEIMIQQDEEFARQLAMKEAELSQAGKEPEVPDFKEIMDMDLALSLYHKDVAEWRHSEPPDLAARLSRDKLCNLFPEVAPDVLCELLVAHGNDFQQTVEVLLISLGKSDILDEENGVNKYVMEKEMERQEKLLQKEQNILTEAEWPLLSQEKIEMSHVQKYRDEAQKHCEARNTNYQKAQDYIRRGMTQVASYYSEVAAFHKKKFELMSSLAAASLIQVHAAKSSDNTIIDLHFLRVAEARESLDLFLDGHIQALREERSARTRTLYVITGRGLHSASGPRLKPAVRRRLRERGLICGQKNPGLLTSRVSADDKLSHQLP